MTRRWPVEHAASGSSDTGDDVDVVAGGSGLVEVGVVVAVVVGGSAPGTADAGGPVRDGSPGELDRLPAVVGVADAPAAGLSGVRWEWWDAATSTLTVASTITTARPAGAMRSHRGLWPTTSEPRAARARRWTARPGIAAW
jgi:hypothetical protein